VERGYPPPSRERGARTRLHAHVGEEIQRDKNEKPEQGPIS